MSDRTRPTNHPIPQRLLGVWAHPDDEAYLSTELMARTVESGGSVTLIAITDGEGGFGEDDHRSPSVKADQRRSELTDAMAVIGVRDIRFLGVPDGEVADHRSSPLVDRIARTMCSVGPDVTATFGPDGITGHPDHIACSRLVTRAWAECGIGELWYAAKSSQWLSEWEDLHRRLGVLMTDDSDPTDLGRDEVEHRLLIAGDRLATKRHVLAAHRSQTEMVAAFMGEETYLAWIAEECFRRPSAVELFDADPHLALANWCHPQRTKVRR